MSKKSTIKVAKTECLSKELKKGERSGFVSNFDGASFLKDLRRRHARKGTSSM